MRKNYDVFYDNEANPYGVKQEILYYDIYKDTKKKRERIKLFGVQRTKPWMAPVFKVEFYNKDNELENKAYVLFNAPFYVRSVKFDTNEIIASDTLTDVQVEKLIDILTTIDKTNEYSIYKNLAESSTKFYKNLLIHKIPNYKNLKGGK